MKRILIGIFLLAGITSASAKIKLPAILGSNMVLQQQTDANLWGEAAPNKQVTVYTSWNKARYTVKADAQGKWLTQVATPAAGGPYTIEISDGEKLVLDNVLIGEVWVCSGQSNMQMAIEGNFGEPTDGSTEALLTATQYPDIRLFDVERKISDTPLTDCGGKWMLNTPENLAPFSAAAYYFGRTLSQALDVPIGLIVTCWGGTRIETWMTVSSARKINPNVLETDATFGGPNKTAVLYNGMIWPIKDFTARGFIWYQGESNIHTQTIPTYAAQMQEMVSLWREVWRNQEMPFYYVQLAPHTYEGADGISLPLMVEQQVRALDMIPNVGMASTTDIGGGVCIHPAQKDKVGERLALLALNKTYGMNALTGQSPRYKSVRFEGKKAVVTMDTPLSLGPNYKHVDGFEIAGADKVFYPAQVGFVPGKPELEITSDRVDAPVAVRYAFRNVPRSATLYNTAKLPAYPFRTDDWNNIK